MTNAVPKEVRFKPRFDFVPDPAPDDSQVGTIKELLAEINQQYGGGVDGREADLKSLGVTLKFIRHFTGKSYGSITESLPLSALKTIKLLYITNDAKDVQLFRLIGPPQAKVRATMEYATGTSIARDKHAASVIATLTEKLALEIKPERRELFDALLKGPERKSTAEQLLALIERTNDEISRTLRERWAGDDIRLAQAFSRLTKAVDCFDHAKRPEAPLVPLNEVIFAHLQGLGFVHFVLHHRRFISEIRIKRPIGSIEAGLDVLCQALSDDGGARVRPDRRALSVNNFSRVVACYTKEFTELVTAATGFQTRKRAFIENIPRARRILISHVYRSFDEKDPDAPLLTLVDVVAALCSVRYQQAVKTRYPPWWQGQVSQGGDPQRHFDRPVEDDDPYQHQGVIQIYLYRFSQFLAVFTGTIKSFDAWMAFQLARLDACVKILQLNNLSAIVSELERFDQVCKRKTIDIAEAM